MNPQQVLPAVAGRQPAVGPSQQRVSMVPRRAPHGRPGIAPATQIVLAEAALFGVVAVIGRPAWALLVVAAVALAVLVLVLGRSGGHWWVDLVTLRWSYRRRRLSRRPDSGEPRLAALGALAPGLTVTTVEHHGRSIGIAHDDAGWFAGIALPPMAGVRGDARPALRLGTLLPRLADSAASLSAVQIVIHTVPALGRGLSEDGQPATASYAALAAGLPGLPAVERTSWIVVRIDPQTAADILTGRADLDALHRTLSTAVTRIGRTAERAGLSHQILDGGGLLTAILRSWGTDPTAPSDPTATVAREQWNSCQVGGLAHACFWVRDLPATANLGLLIDACAGTPAALTSVSLGTEPVPGDQDELRLRLLVRVAVEPAALSRTCQILTATAGNHGARLTRLDGEQGPAIYATAPTGGLTL